LNIKGLEDKIEKIPIAGCWLWIGALHHSGYGIYNSRSAHRLVYQLLTGKDIGGKCLCHHCDVKSCVNPNHLFVGTQADNIADMDNKGRRANFKGEASPTSRLTENDVRAIRSDSRPQKEIAKDYGVTNKQISNIKTRYSWKHI
jgi:hypothetical protein